MANAKPLLIQLKAKDVKPSVEIVEAVRASTLPQIVRRERAD